jgi:hypothetical protein
MSHQWFGDEVHFYVLVLKKEKFSLSRWEIVPAFMFPWEYAVLCPMIEKLPKQYVNQLDTTALWMLEAHSKWRILITTFIPLTCSDIFFDFGRSLQQAVEKPEQIIRNSEEDSRINLKPINRVMRNSMNTRLSNWKKTQNMLHHYSDLALFCLDEEFL